jgi:hypothetical protein
MSPSLDVTWRWKMRALMLVGAIVLAVLVGCTAQPGTGEIGTQTPEAAGSEDVITATREVPASPDAITTTPDADEPESGEVGSETREVQGVREVRLSGIGTLHIQQGDQESLEIEAEADIIPEIRTRVENGVLIIDYRSSISATEPIEFHLTVPDLQGIELSGAANVEVPWLNTDQLNVTVDGTGEVQMKDLQANAVVVTISGAGTASAFGQVMRQEVQITGSGEYRAADLQSSEATVDVAGAGNATVRVSDALNVQISGAGDVAYIGDPQVTQEITGIGEVRKLSGQ